VRCRQLLQADVAAQQATHHVARFGQRSHQR
jgi:hypothetical protein